MTAPRDRWKRLALRITGTALVFFWHLGVGIAQPIPDQAPAQPPGQPLEVSLFLRAFLDQPEQAEQAFDLLEANWDDSYVVMMLELSQFADPDVRGDLFDFLEEMTEEDLGPDRVLPHRNAPGYAWVARNNPRRHPDYADFKAGLYARIDTRLGRFFGKGRPASVFLDEIRWKMAPTWDQKPILRDVAAMAPAQANQLPPAAPVYGVVIGGAARAYLKTLLLGRELVKDELSGSELLGIHAPIDGSTVFYRLGDVGAGHQLEDSGFFYRGSKLLYDEGTKSLWSSMSGTPVVGSLTGRDIELERVPFVATTWAEWRRRHPQTSVVGPPPDQPRAPVQRPAPVLPGEQLVYAVPKLDPRLRVKAEVLALRWPSAPNQRLAVSVDFLRRQRVYHGKLGEIRFVVLTDRSGAHRVYESGPRTFAQWNGDRVVTERDGKTWALSENELTREGQALKRLPVQYAFWYAWAAANPDTALVK